MDSELRTRLWNAIFFTFWKKFPRIFTDHPYYHHFMEVIWDDFLKSGKSLETPPEDSYLIEYPYVLNAYIAGYWGYLELENLATGTETRSIRDELNRLLSLRVNNFSKGRRALSHE